jgi:hypothetical protein
MKKPINLLTYLIAAITILLVLFPPQKFSKGGGMIPNFSNMICKGIYIQTYNDTSVDGDRGGYCLGKVTNKFKNSALTQDEAERLVKKEWANYIFDDAVFKIEVKQNDNVYRVSVIHGNPNDKKEALKTEGMALFHEDGSWSLMQPDQMSCNSELNKESCF